MNVKLLSFFKKLGSGKRTLAKQIASKLAIEEGKKIKVTHPATIPRFSTVYFNYEEMQRGKILFHCDDKNETGKLDLDAKIRNISRLFPENLVVRISFPIESLTKIAQKKKENILIENIRKTIEKIAENNTSSGMCRTLTLTLFLRSQFYQHG